MTQNDQAFSSEIISFAKALDDFQRFPQPVVNFFLKE